MISIMDEIDYKAVYETSNVAIAVIESDATVSMVNTKILQMFQATEREVVGTTFLDWIHEDDRALLAHNHKKRVAGEANLPENYEIRMLAKHGIIWVSLYVAYSKKLHKSVVSFVETTKIHEAEHKLQLQINAQNAILTAIPDLMFELSQEGEYLNVWAHNPKELAEQKELLYGKNVKEVLSAPAADVVMQTIQETLQNGAARSDAIQVNTPSGELWFELSAGKKENLDAADTIIMLSRNITERKKLELELLHLSRHDSLTNLYTRRILESKLHDDILRAKRYKTPLSVCMLDIDHFKKVNDTYGHAVGDRVLQTLATTIRDNLREVDYVARYGGEEFVIVLPDTNLDDAYDFADRLRNIVANRQLHPETNKKFTISISIGIASFHNHCDTADKLLNEADEKMYLAKESGRNCVKI